MKRTICITILAFALFSASWHVQAADKLRLNTVVIDAGHGGNDPGCVSADRKTYEKTLTLDIAKKLQALINQSYPDVKTVLTRGKDDYVTLNDRADRANKAGGQLFISIHINATTSKTPNGYSIHVLGQSSQKDRDLYAGNMDVVRRENSVIMLEDDYSTKYMGFDPSDPESYIFMLLMQNAHLEESIRFAQIISTKLGKGPLATNRGLHQDPFYVLWKTAMPSVLVELGFISNANDLNTLRQESNRAKLAECLFNAFSEYKTLYDRSLDSSAPESAPAKVETKAVEKKAEEKKAAEPVAPAAKPATSQPAVPAAQPAASGKTQYAVQVLVSGRNMDPKSSVFMGYEAKSIKVGNVYKYFICVSDTVDKPRKELASIRKRFPDCFLVKIDGEEVSRVK